jgi:hypothetical protein
VGEWRGNITAIPGVTSTIIRGAGGEAGGRKDSGDRGGAGPGSPRN